MNKEKIFSSCHVQVHVAPSRRCQELAAISYIGLRKEKKTIEEDDLILFLQFQRNKEQERLKTTFCHKASSGTATCRVKKELLFFLFRSFQLRRQQSVRQESFVSTLLQRHCDL